jgi:long-chain alkane monooxygenase
MPEIAPRPLHFAAFVMNTTGHIVQGTWRRPSAQQTDFNDLDHWVNLAKTLERGKFDAIFFADVVGVYAPYRGDERKYFEAGLQVPSNDPSVLASALAYATEHLGIAFTASVLQEHPFNFARRISTLDHASKGRIAWNIVTNYLPNASRNFGYEGLTAHDERYAWADEYVDVAYKLWEGSWEEDALLQDRVRGIHADYDKVHRINHEGPRYRVEGPHLVSPSPQRTPLLFQAGASEAGRTFAAKNAEAVFLGTPNPIAAARDTADIRRRAVEHGRRAEDLKFFQGLSVVVGSTEAEAKRLADELDEWIDWDAQLSHISGSLQIDFGFDDLDTPVGEIETEGVQSAIGWFKDLVTDRPATLREVA